MSREKEEMSLEQELAAFKAEFSRTAPAGRAALYEAKIEELRSDFALERAIKLGDTAPDFALPDAAGKSVVLTDVLRSGPVVLTFYRGGWCPYCNIQLRAYQSVLPRISALGGRLVAISPQLPGNSLDTVSKNALTFDVLSDVGNEVARNTVLFIRSPKKFVQPFARITRLFRRSTATKAGNWRFLRRMSQRVTGALRLGISRLTIGSGASPKHC